MSDDRTFRVGIDIGGTFTDFTVVDDSGSVFLWKEDSTPDEPTRAIMKRARRRSPTSSTSRSSRLLQQQRPVRARHDRRDERRHPAERPGRRPALHRGLPRHPLLQERIQARPLQHPPRRIRWSSSRGTCGSAYPSACCATARCAGRSTRTPSGRPRRAFARRGCGRWRSRSSGRSSMTPRAPRRGGAA